MKSGGKMIALPGIGGFMLFYVFPLILTVYYSVIDNVFSKNIVGISNFIDILGNKYYLLALKNTVIFTIISVPLLMVISTALSLMLVSVENRYALYRTIFTLPVVLPSASLILIWQTMYSEGGLIYNSFFLKDIVFNENSIYIVSILVFFVWKYTGINIIVLVAGLMNIPHEVYEAAYIDGAGNFKRHQYITLPLLLPALFFAFILSIVNSLKIFKEVYLLYGSYPHESIYLIQHYMNNHFNKLNYQYLTSGALVFGFLLTLVITVGYMIEKKLSNGVW